MKKLFIHVLLLSNFFGYAQYTLIPDVNFEKALISQGIDSGSPDGRVLTANVSGITSFGISDTDLTDLTGIQDFVSLTELQCPRNKLTSLDISKNTSLTILSCWGNNLTALDTSKNAGLKFLSCFQNRLKSLDISKNPLMSQLYCSWNELTSLNLKNGNNKDLIALNVWSNANLTCIQVDNKTYSDTSWLASSKDATASYSENCSKTAAPIAPPVITATGNQTYCAGTSQKIVETISISNDPAEPSTDAIYIQISAGYNNSQDLLSLANPNSHPNLTSSWDALEGKLKLFSPSGAKVLYTDFAKAIGDVEYSNSSSNPTGTRDFSITIGQANFLPSTGHYYQFVPNIGITWTAAKTAAESLNYYGLKGYLATILSAEEAQISGEQASGAGWIGGSDQETEGVWKWITGPEGLANGRTGIIFWNGLVTGTTPNYAKWNTNEPNQYMGREEDYAHITAPGVGITGSWNDLTITGDANGNYQPKGFIVEYGGMPGDPILQISASTKLTMSQLTISPVNSICSTEKTTLNASSTSSSINWYDKANGGTLLFTGNSFTTPALNTTTTFYIDNGCSKRNPITVPVNPIPTVNAVEIVQCDADLVADGKTFFNLTIKNQEISSNFANETFTYYNSQNGAINAVSSDLILNPLAYENTTPSLMAIWTRITNKISGCSNVSKITLKVPATNIPPTFKIFFPPVCDDFLDTDGNNNANNNKRDGITSFDFSAIEAKIKALLPPTDVYTISYYKNQNDALAELNPITNTSNYRNIGYPNTQDIWIRIDSDLDNACYGLGPYLTLNVEALPYANQTVIARQCDDNTDGIFEFNTTTLEKDILKGQTNKTVTYFDQWNNPLKDAYGTLITSPFPSTFYSKSQTIQAIVTNNTIQKCLDTTQITFTVDQSPLAFAIDPKLTTSCDDEADPKFQDGKYAFDSSTFETIILGGQTGMIVKYYDQNNVLLPSHLPNPFLTQTQTITARVENPINSSCFATTSLNFLVHTVPNINLNLDGGDDNLVCQNDPNFYITLNAGIEDGTPTSNYTYIWSKDGTVIPGETAYQLDVNEEGIYTVQVSNNLGCSKVRTIKVTASDVAKIDSIDIQDMADTNTIIVNISASSLGNYEFSLDDPLGPFQDSNIFNEVAAGIHTVYINDKNGCRPNTKSTIAVVGAPKFFTPNGDGYNDYWSIPGVNSSFNSKSIIYIFDRFGKLLKQWIPTSNQGWDGTFEGIPMPADDYWFTLKLEDGRETKGHFSLKR
jgi:gliding motility-associated-like protein